VQAAAYATESMGRLSNLEKWLYSQGSSKNNQQQQYKIYNDPDLF
ncbi:unnamed protein product, partial [Adineta steineri]